MDKLLVVLEEALEAGGYTVDPIPVANSDVRLREFGVISSDSDSVHPEFIVTVEYA